MTNYSMQKGRERNDKIKFIKRFILGLAIAYTLIFGVIQLFKYWDKQDAKLMGIEYCWDSNGEHFVSPDERCGN